MDYPGLVPEVTLLTYRFSSSSSFQNRPPLLPTDRTKGTGVGIAQWLEHWTCDWKVVGSNPCRSGGRIFFSRVDFVCWLLFWYLFHPRVTTEARKRSWSFCQKCRWQVMSKHAYTLRIHVALHEATWCMVVWCTQNLCWDGCSFMWHQPCQLHKYTTSVDIQKHAIKS